MHCRTFLAIALLTAGFALGCDDDSSPTASSSNSPPNPSPECVEDLTTSYLLTMGIAGGFGGVTNYRMGLTRHGILTVVCDGGTRVDVPLAPETFAAVLAAREDAHLRELEPEYLGQGADGYEYDLVDFGCAPHVRIRTDDYAMPEPLRVLIPLLLQTAFDALSPFGEECRTYTFESPAPVR